MDWFMRCSPRQENMTTH